MKKYGYCQKLVPNIGQEKLQVHQSQVRICGNNAIFMKYNMAIMVLEYVWLNDIAS